MILKKLTLAALAAAALFAGSAATPALAHDRDGVSFGIVIGDSPRWGWDRDGDWDRDHWRHERWERERAWRYHEWRRARWEREHSYRHRFHDWHHGDGDW